MDFDDLAKKAKQIVDKRGGVESLKEDALELKEIIEHEGTLAEKAKAAAAAIKEPGAHHEGATPNAGGSTPAAAGTGSDAGTPPPEPDQR